MLNLFKLHIMNEKYTRLYEIPRGGQLEISGILKYLKYPGILQFQKYRVILQL